MKSEDPVAIHNMGCEYRDGTYGFPQDYDKAMDLYHRAGKLGSAEAYTNIAYAYMNGRGVEVDKKRARHYYELAAMRGCTNARHNLGLKEEMVGNMDRALKHWMIAVGNGESDSLEMIKQLYLDGHATKDDYSTALHMYQEYLGEIKSRQRDEAAASSESSRYY